MKFNWQPTAWINAVVRFVIFSFDNIEHLLLVVVSRLAPWAAPLAPAYFVAHTIQKHFVTPAWVAIAVGVTVEAVGIASTHVTLEMYTYNQAKRKTDPPAPFNVGVAVSGIYFVTGIVLTVVLEIIPSSVIIAPAFFFLLAIVAYIVLALMSDHAKRVQGIAELKAEQKAEHKRNKSGTGTAEQTGGTYGEISDTTKDLAWAILAERPGIPGAELGRELGKSDSLGRRLKREYERINLNGSNHE